MLGINSVVFSFGFFFQYSFSRVLNKVNFIRRIYFFKKLKRENKALRY